MVRIQNMRHLAFNLIPWEYFKKFIILSKIDENIFFEKCVLKLCRTAMIKPRQIEHSGFFYLTTTDKLEFADWCGVHQMFGWKENGILRWRIGMRTIFQKKVFDFCFFYIRSWHFALHINVLTRVVSFFFSGKISEKACLSRNIKFW